MTTEGIDDPDVADADTSFVDVSDLPETKLRSALEFAVGIAAAGQKLRPPLAFPSGLKPYLKLNRLDRNSLHGARRVVVGDAEFRGRLALVATADLVDEIGLLWLTRPEGWVESINEVIARTKEAEAAESIEAQLRRAERRREAAEQVAARTQAELLGHHDAVAREQMRRERAEHVATSARAATASAQQEISRLRAEIVRLQAQVDVESARNESTAARIAELEVRATEAETTRDQLLASRSEVRDSPREGPGSPQAAANASAAQALRGAASATRDLAAALAAASDALSGDEAGGAVAVQPPKWVRERRSQRRPVAIPGGVYGDSVAAGEYLVRVPGARVIVDAYNVAKLAWPGRELIDQRECVISLLEDFVRRTGVDLHAVFDGADIVGASAGRRIVRVQYSPAGVSADDVIRDIVASLPPSTPVIVATNDQAIVNDVRVAGANTVSSDVMLVVLGFTSPSNHRR